MIIKYQIFSVVGNGFVRQRHFLVKWPFSFKRLGYGEEDGDNDDDDQGWLSYYFINVACMNKSFPKNNWGSFLSRQFINKKGFAGFIWSAGGNEEKQ